MLELLGSEMSISVNLYTPYRLSYTHLIGQLSKASVELPYLFSREYPLGFTPPIYGKHITKKLDVLPYGMMPLLAVRKKICRGEKERWNFTLPFQYPILLTIPFGFREALNSRIYQIYNIIKLPIFVQSLPSIYLESN